MSNFPFVLICVICNGINMFQISLIGGYIIAFRLWLLKFNLPWFVEDLGEEEYS